MKWGVQVKSKTERELDMTSVCHNKSHSSVAHTEESKLAECTSHRTQRKHFCKAMSKANALELRRGSAGSVADAWPLFYMGRVIPALCSTLKVPRQHLAKLFCTQAQVLWAALCEEINEWVKARHWDFLILYLFWWVSITKGLSCSLIEQQSGWMRVKNVTFISDMQYKHCPNHTLMHCASVRTQRLRT